MVTPAATPPAPRWPQWRRLRNTLHRADTLFARLFVLLWLALVVSHLAAFGIITQGILPLLRPELARGKVPLPDKPLVLSSLAPTPAALLPAGPASSTPHAEPVHPPDLPVSLFLLDYLIRAVLLTGFAWWGARWLAQPMQRLSRAARALGASLARGEPPVLLDEQQGTQEVRTASRVFNTLASDLAQELRSREMVLAAASHDLRTPLTRLRLRLEPLAGQEDVRACITDIRIMNELIGHALELVRQSPSSSALQPTDVEALVQAAVDDLNELMPARPDPSATPALQLLTPAGDQPPLIALAHPVALQRALTNVLHNALRYANGAQVAIQPSADGQRIAIVVRDHGPGIAAAELEQVQQPFVRGTENGCCEAPDAAPAAGLGLYIARDLMRRQGGSLQLAPAPEGGLQVRLEIAAQP